MSNGYHSLVVDGAPIPLRSVDHVRLVTPARNQHPATVASRLARSSRLAIDTAYPAEHLVIVGEKSKLDDVRSYPDVQNTRGAFQDPQGNLLVLTNEILIRFVDGSSDYDRERLLARFDGLVSERGAAVWKFRVNDPALDAPLVLAQELSRDSLVIYAEPNALQAATFHLLPQNEPRFANQWTLQNTGQNGGSIGADVRALGAWSITTGLPSIGIVVHDTGVDINHPDLVANIRAGWDFDNNDNDATNNTAPHGTACAGIIASSVTGRGIVGIAPNCGIIPLRAANARTFQGWADTFNWAAERGRIISCSWTMTPSNTVSDAIRAAVGKGVTVFCAAGNGFIGIVGDPASMAETIAVGASTNQDVRAIYSQFGIGLDVVAPSNGGTLNIETTDVRGAGGYNAAISPAGDYCNAADATGFGGTSAATPLTAGIAGLMLSVSPLLALSEIRTILRETAEKIDPVNAAYDGSGRSAQYGFGRVNAANAVRRARTQTRLFTAFVADNSTNSLLVASSGLGIDWSGNTPINQASQEAPSLTVFKRQLWMAFVANNPTNDLLVASSGDGVTWSGNTRVGQSGQGAPAIAEFNGQLWMAFAANNSSHDLLVAFAGDGLHWSGNTRTNQSSSQPPALAAFNGQLWMAFVADNSSHDLLVSSSGNWARNTPTRQSSKFAPALAVFRGQLWMAFVADNPSNDLLLASSKDGVTWSGNTRLGQSSHSAPTLAVFGDQLWMSFIADNSSNDVLVASSNNWVENRRIGQSSKFAPSLTHFTS